MILERKAGRLLVKAYDDPGGGGPGRGGEAAQRACGAGRQGSCG